MTLKEAYAIIPKTCECITLHCKRDFADAIKVMNLEMRELSWMNQ